MTKSRILVADDEEIMRLSITDWLSDDGYEVIAVEDGYQALAKIENEKWDLAIIDLKMPKMDGIEVLRKLNQVQSKLPVILITAYATVESAVLAMKEGAADYIVKPFDPEEISIIVAKIVEHQRLVKENIHLRKELIKRFRFQDFISKSHKMAKVIEMIKMVAPTKSTVLIKGESGTGKELAARAIHELSPRKKASFIAAACGAIPETLLEAELFGYEKGAFTGAAVQHKGRIEIADKGTQFLDEIGDVSLKTQVDLLRFLQEREFRRIGGKTPIQVDIRIIAATNKNLEKMVAAGTFRDDLYYRLNVITILILPLRERKEDIPVLLDHFLEKFCLDMGKQIMSVSEEVMNALYSYDWPGNVRQLENTIEHAVVVAQGTVIQINNLPDYLSQPKTGEYTISPDFVSLDDVEKQHILHILKMNNWNIKQSAQVLGINRATLYSKIEKYKLKLAEQEN